MKRKIRGLCALLLCLCLCLPVLRAAAAGESFVPAAAPRLIYAGSDRGPRVSSTLALAASEFAAAGFPLTPVFGGDFAARPGDIVVLPDFSLPREGYELKISARNILLRYSPGEISPFYGGEADQNGLLYGLREILKRLTGNGAVEAGCISRAPETGERIFMLDCARKYFTPEWICSLIRQISWLGFNGLELHLSEEQGLRADIWDSGEFSWLCGSTPAPWVFDCPDPDGGKYLTAFELDRIMKTAEQYHVEIIPALESPGHCRHLCSAFETRARQTADFSFSFGGETFRPGETGAYRIAAPGDSNVLDLENPAAVAFFSRILSDFADFFGTYGCTKFNLCADEVPELCSPEKFTDYVNQMAELLQKKGYEVRTFNDALSDRFAPSVGTVYWHTPEGQPVPQDRKLWNASQEYSYCALRKFNVPGYEDNPYFGLDARDPENRWWTFGGGTAEKIFEEWDPSVLPGTQEKPGNTAGSYYLLWCDYPGFTTEQALWTEWDFQEKLRSHIAKAWDRDLQKQVSFEEFTAWGEKTGNYPGMTDCTQPPELPPAPEILSRRGADLCTLRRFLSGTETGKLSPEEAEKPEISYVCLSVPG